MPEKIKRLVRLLDPATQDEIEEALEYSDPEEITSWLTEKFGIEL